MTADDAFQRRLRDIAARFHDWSLPLVNHADFAVDDTDGYWRFAGTPRLATACPFEILIHPSNLVDYFICDQVYEERNLEPLERMLSLVKAIASGKIITRFWHSMNTAAVSRIDTIITLDDDTIWQDSNKTGPMTAPPVIRAQYRDRHYMPYKR